MNSSEPRVILVTGAARRIGKTIAEFLHQQGMRIIIHCHQSESEAWTLCAELNQKRSDTAVVVRADLSKLDQLEQMAEQSVAAWGYVDGLINCASSFYVTPMGQAEDSQWQELMDVNVKAPFFLAQLMATHLKERQGNIINISDIHASLPLRHYPLYSVSKAALNMLTMSLAKELAPDIRVNAVAPGMIIWSEGANEQQEQLRQEILSRVALKRIGRPLDIAKAVLFFIEADYVTGQILAVDGGRSLNC